MTPESAILRTHRLWVRPFKEDDLLILANLHQDPVTMRHLVGGARASLDDVKRDLDFYIRHQTEHGFSKWAVFQNESNAFVGRAGFLAIPDSTELDFGFVLASGYWGRGYATEVSRGIIEWARGKVPLENIVGLVDAGHTASSRVLLKSGFCAAGTGTYYGLPFDVFKLTHVG